MNYLEAIELLDRLDYPGPNTPKEYSEIIGKLLYSGNTQGELIYYIDLIGKKSGADNGNNFQ